MVGEGLTTCGSKKFKSAFRNNITYDLTTHPSSRLWLFSFTEKLIEQFVSPLQAKAGKEHGFCLTFRIVDVALFVQTVHYRPVVTFPSTATEFGCIVEG